MNYAIEIAGWAGAVLMLTAYILLTLGKLRSSSAAYHVLNTLAGAGLIINSGWNGAYPSVAINVVWMAIGLYGVLSRRRLLAPERGRE